MSNLPPPPNDRPPPGGFRYSGVPVPQPARRQLGTGPIIAIAIASVCLLCCIGGGIALVGTTTGTTNTPASGDDRRTSSKQTPAPTQPQPSSTAVLPFEVAQRHDVSAGSGAKRLAIRVELRHFPITRDQLIAVAMRVVDDHRGRGWQALSIAIMYDRREVVPSFATMEWAPDGRWDNASKGDGKTWSGYQLHVQLIQNKVMRPETCTIPSEQAYVLNGEFNKATKDNVSITEEAVLAGIADRHHLPLSAVQTQVVSVEDWTMC